MSATIQPDRLAWRTGIFRGRLWGITAVCWTTYYLSPLLAGWLLAFTLSLDDLIIASFVSGPGSVTLPMLIYSRVRLGLRPDINALATIIILVVAICVAIAFWLMLRQQRQRQRDLEMMGKDGD